LGFGPTSTIYGAQSLELGRWVALILYSITLPDERSQRRFRRGYEVGRRLGAHPHAVTLLDTGLTSDRRPFIAAEIYERGTLEGRIESRQLLSVREMLHVGIALAGALETAHRAEVIHGGVHPGRVLLGADGEPALADLGVVPLVDRSGLAALIGPMTHHAPPEVLEGEEISPATDVYSLASTLYAALTGRAPYAGDTPEDDSTPALLVRILQHAVPPLGLPDAPPSLDAALRQALSCEPKNRPARPLAFARMLQSCQQELGFPVTQPIILDVAATLNLAVTPSEPMPAPPIPDPAPASPAYDFPPAAPAFDPPAVPGPPMSAPEPPGLDLLPPPPRGTPPELDLPPASPAFDPPAPPGLASGAAPVPDLDLMPPPPSSPVERVFVPYPLPETERPDPSDWPAPAEEPAMATAPPDSDLLIPPDFVPQPTYEPEPGGFAPDGYEYEPEPEAEADEGGPGTIRALPVIVLALVVAVIFAAVTWSIVTGEAPEEERAQPGSTDSDTQPDQTGPGTELTAVENANGVQLDWNDAGTGDKQVVLLFSTTEPPRVLPADAGTALLIPTADLDPSSGYCFAVLPAPEGGATNADLAESVDDQRLGPDACIRNGSAAAILRH
jgi:serine/threonine-protein kinase PknK